MDQMYAKSAWDRGGGEGEEYRGRDVDAEQTVGDHAGRHGVDALGGAERGEDVLRGEVGLVAGGADEPGGGAESLGVGE